MLSRVIKYARTTLLHNYKKPKEITYKQLFINNQFVDGKQKLTIPIINPATEELITNVAQATEIDIDLAVQAAREAQPQWKSIDSHERGLLMFRLADIIERDLKEFVELESLDNGKPLSQSEEDVQQVILNIRYYAGQADKITGKIYRSGGHDLFYTRREPFGVIGIISPWNFPMLMGAWKFSPALAAGNCVVHKPSEMTPLSILRLAASINEAGFPPGVYNVVPGLGHIAGQALALHTKIDNISFTGSLNVGRKVLEGSSKSNLKQIGLSMGSKNPIIICPEADLERAVDITWECLTHNSGQSCFAGSIVYVHEKVQQQFCKMLLEKKKKIIAKEAFQEGNFGPLISQVQLDNYLNKIKRVVEKEKLEFLMQGNKIAGKGYFVEPTIFQNVPDNSQLAQEEILGPVLCIMKPWKTLKEVIQRVNNRNIGLNALVITNDQSVAEKLVCNIEAGTILVNNYQTPQAFMPFGGYKESGFGRDNAEESIYEFTQLKSVWYYMKEPNY